MGHQVRNLVLRHLHLVDAAELELALLVRDTVQHEAPLGVVQQTEQVARLLDLHDVCRIFVNQDGVEGGTGFHVRRTNENDTWQTQKKGRTVCKYQMPKLGVVTIRIPIPLFAQSLPIYKNHDWLGGQLPGEW